MGRVKSPCGSFIPTPPLPPTILISASSCGFLTQAAQPDGIYQLKNRRVCSNAKSERNDGDHSEARTLRQQTGGMAQILRDGFQPRNGVHAIDLLSNQSRVSKSAAGSGGRLRGSQSARDVIGRFGLKGRKQSQAFVPHPNTCALETAASSCSIYSSAGRKTWLTARTTRSQRLVSTCNCLRPAVVSR